MRTRTRGQSTVEYAVMIAVIIGALLAMQIYLKRGAMGKLRETADQLGDQFSPGFTNFSYTRNTNGVRSENSFANGLSMTNFQNERQTRTGSENIIQNLNQENLFYN